MKNDPEFEKRITEYIKLRLAKTPAECRDDLLLDIADGRHLPYFADTRILTPAGKGRLLGKAADKKLVHCRVGAHWWTYPVHQVIPQEWVMKRRSA